MGLINLIGIEVPDTKKRMTVFVTSTQFPSKFFFNMNSTDYKLYVMSVKFLSLILEQYLMALIICFLKKIILFILCLVDGGQRAVIFDRFRGVLPDVSGEGTHFLIPWVQRAIIFDVRSRPRNVPVITGSKGE